MQHGTHPNKVSKYQEYEHEFTMSEIQYPVVIKNIGKFEYQSVYGYEDKKIFPLRIINITIARDHVNLLYITAGEKSHYVLVKDLSRLVLIQYNNHNSKHYFCQSCLHGYTSEEVLKNYMERSKLHGTQRIKLTEAGNKKRRHKVKFTKKNIKLCLPSVIYADFESVLCKQNSAIVIKILHHPIPTSRNMWELHLCGIQ